jgi:RimJ/RimL family protein N-acetyltransferase
VPFFAPEEHHAGALLLRSWRPGDGQELNRATVSSYEHLREFMAWARPDTSVEDSEGYARQSRARWLLGEEWSLGVWRGDRLVAGSGFMLRGQPLEHGTVEIGMWVRADEAGRGLGTRVLRAMVDWADADWPIHKLTWQCDSRNLASARVAEKCGFQLEGHLRAHVPSVTGGERRSTLLFGLVGGDPRPWRSRPRPPA